jgi:hypothetical protein
MMKKGIQVIVFIAIILLLRDSVFAQKVNDFPKRTDPLHVKVKMFDALVRGNHWNEGTIMQHVIFPPAGLDRPIVGSQEDCFDQTAEMLAAYSYKYAVTKNEADREIANQLFEGLLKLEKVTGVPGLVARSFNKTDEPLWHEQVYFFPAEWHWSSSMPGYRWQGDLSADKFTSMFYAVGLFGEHCADVSYKEKAAGLLDRFLGRCVDNNFKLVDLDGKMTLWGNYCPDLPHQPLNSLEMLMALKVTHRITGKERYNAAYRMLIDRYHYDDHQLTAKMLWPDEWKTAPWDDDLAAKSFYMIMRYEDNRSLLIKYRMSLNRHWYEWQHHNFSYDGDAWFIMAYQVLTGEEILTDRIVKGIKDMWGFDRHTRTFRIPTKDGYKNVESAEEGSATALIRNYWFGRYYDLIDPEW